MQIVPFPASILSLEVEPSFFGGFWKKEEKNNLDRVLFLVINWVKNGDGLASLERPIPSSDTSFEGG